MEFYGTYKEFENKGLDMTKNGSDDVLDEDSSDEQVATSEEKIAMWENNNKSNESAVSSIRRRSILKCARHQSRRQTGSISSTRKVTWKREVNIS